MSRTPMLQTLLVLVNGLVLKFALFWGIPCKLPTTRANDDVLFLRACARAKWKAMFFQKLPIYLMMAPVWGIVLFSNSAAAVIIMWYLLPLVLVGAIGIVAGTVAATSGSFDIHTRNEYVRLQLAASATPSGRISTVYVSASDVTQRMRTRLDGQPWNVPMPPKPAGRPAA